MSFSLYLWVGLGGALGSMARLGLGNWFVERTGPAFPWGTLTINVAGSFVIGFVATLTSSIGRAPSSDLTRQFLMTGVLGGFTTFSAFSLQTLTLARQQQWGLAAAYVMASVILCLIGVTLGHALATALSPTASP